MAAWKSWRQIKCKVCGETFIGRHKQIICKKPECKRAYWRELKRNPKSAPKDEPKPRPIPGARDGDCITVVSCPGNEIPRGGMFPVYNFKVSLKAGIWPGGMVVQRRGALYRVEYTEYVEQKLVAI